MNAPKQKFVSVDEVSVSTVSVEIKTISVGRRQMSMALFRQLPKQPLIDLDDGDLRLNGMPWGRVNYHWDDGCPIDSRHGGVAEHVHVLWQQGKTLIQSAVRKHVRFLDDEDAIKTASDDCRVFSRVGALLCAISTSAEIKIDKDTIRIGRWMATEPETYGSSLSWLMTSFRDAPDISSSPAHTSYCSKARKREELEKRIVSLCGEYGLEVPTTEDQAWSLYQEAVAREANLRSKYSRLLDIYDKRYQELLALEQLFISA